MMNNIEDMKARADIMKREYDELMDMIAEREASERQYEFMLHKLMEN